VAIDSYEASGVMAQFGSTRFKYLIGRTGGSEELFDLESKEAGTVNLVDQPAARPILNHMHALHSQLLHQNDSNNRLN
jgi:hypothetical protein